MFQECYRPCRNHLEEATICVANAIRNERTGRVLSCGVYSDPYGIEARCGYHNEETLLMSQVADSKAAAMMIAEEWKGVAIDKGFSMA